MLTLLYSVFVTLALFGVTIFIHELGHFLAARWCGMVVDTFSIGFGPALWKRKINGVVYKIGILPFGGYVALPQMDPGGGKQTQDGDERALPPVEPWKKILVSLAGVTGNMILAYLLAWMVFWGGKSFAPPENTIVGFVDTNSVAYVAGLRPGDVIESVNGQPIRNWDQFLLRCALYPEVELGVRKAGGDTGVVSLQTDEMMGARYVRGLLPFAYCRVIKVMPGSSAEAAGIQPNDELIEFDGHTLYSREHFISLVRQRPDQILPLTVQRGGRRLELSVQPRFDEARGVVLIGVEFNTLDVKPPGQQIKGHLAMIFNVLKALVTPQESKAAASSLGGPVAIINMFWWAVQNSFILALWFTVLVNVNLAVLNLLPIPVLDGGHIIFTLWEWITRRPVGPRAINAIWNVFAALLLLLFATLTYRDVARLASPRGKSDPPPAEAVTNLPAEQTP